MFAWIRKVFSVMSRKKTVRSAINQCDAQQRDLVLTFLRDNPHLSAHEAEQLARILALLESRGHADDTKKMLVGDLRLRMFKQSGGGASSSPISS